jgi:hypothetical protein
MRADNAAIHARKEMEPMIVKSPGQEAADKEREEHRLQVRGGIMKQLRGESNE